MKKASDVQVGGDHYKKFAIQPSEYCQKNQLLHLESNAIKYISRHRLKGAGRQDLLKAKHCIDLILEWEYPDHGGEAPE